MLVNTAGYILDVDVEATKAYYANNTLCICPDCRNFYAQARGKLPVLTAFLADFGVDIDRPDELAAFKIRNTLDYSFVAYTVVGTIVQSGQKKFTLTDGLVGLEITMDNSYIPNEQATETYFVITVYNISFPWKLDEPYPDEKPNTSLVGKIKAFFSKKQSPTIPPRPTWDEVVKIMYDKNLTFDEDLVKVIYSEDKAQRYVVLKSKKGFYTYRLETLYAFDEEEWRYTYSGEDTLPGMWETLTSGNSRSFFGSEDEAMIDLIAEPVYKEFFGSKGC